MADTADLAADFARIALVNVATEYPYKLDQVLGSDADVRAPRKLHPAFRGSYDWHSCVHSTGRWFGCCACIRTTRWQTQPESTWTYA